MTRKRIRASASRRRIAHGKQNAGGRVTGSAVSLGRAELVLAYELRQEGCHWGVIAKALGVTVDHLSRRIKQCERDGIKWIAA
jgi:DNA-binding MarR family transcriptional regulator